MGLIYPPVVGSAIVVESEPYFLGGQHRKVFINGEQRLSIIPQPAANGKIHGGLFEVATVRGDDLEVVGAFLSRSEVQQVVGEMVLNGDF